jgi:hypothetical protein
MAKTDSDLAKEEIEKIFKEKIGKENRLEFVGADIELAFNSLEYHKKLLNRKLEREGQTKKEKIDQDVFSAAIDKILVIKA